MKYRVGQRIYVFLIILFFISVFPLHFLFYKDRILTSPPLSKHSLEQDGFCIIPNVLSTNDVNKLRNMCNTQQYKDAKTELLNHPGLNKIKDEYTSPDYEFQDYIWIIQQSAVHTCHRDNNGDFFNENQQHPSYTMLVYLEDMDKCLGVIPKSHTSLYANSVNFTDPVENIRCHCGDVILFNANLIHVGTINERDDNLRIQLKVTHRDDIQHIAYYEDFNKVLKQPNTLPRELRTIQKRASCMFPVVSNFTQTENIRTARGSDNGIDIGMPLQIFSYIFYGNADFYNLPNAF